MFLGLSLESFAQHIQLFDHVDSPETEWAGQQVADMRQVEIQVHDPVLNRIKDGNITEFSVMGFNGTEYTIEVRRVIHQLNGDWSAIGWINGQWEDSFILSYSDGEVLSAIRDLSNHNFMEIRFDRELNNHMLVEVDPHERDELRCGHDPTLDIPDDAEQSPLEGFQLPDTAERPVVVDVMIVYTPSAESWANSAGGGIHNVINQAMAIAQRSADNSTLNLEFRLVHRARVNYSETGRSSNDLRNLTFGSVPNVRSLRNQYGADLVSMFTVANDVGGVTWRMSSTSGASEYAYSIVRVQQAGWSSTLAHELGHKFGNHHSRNQRSSPAPPSGGVYSYSTGWRWTGTNGRSYASVMTYREASSMVDIFSTPNVSFSGTPAGSYTGTGAPADNARSMSEMMGVISSYRDTRVVTSSPSVTTAGVSSITRSSAVAGGSVFSDGGSAVTARGVCWSRNRLPGFSDSCQSSGSGTGSFSVTLNNLTPATTYYVRAYATNSVGTGFGSEVSFTTDLVRVHPLLSSIESNRVKVQANNQDAALITVTARDLEGIRLAGFQTTLKALSGTLVSAPQSAVTNAQGAAVFEVTNSRVEPVRYTAVSGGVELQSSVTISYIGIDARLSEMRIDTTEVEADGESRAEITVLARDEDGNPFGNIDMELIADGGNSVIEAVQRRTDSEGVAIFRVSNQQPGRITFSASALGTTLEQTVSVSFIPRAPVALAASDVEARSFLANWEVAEGASGYQLDLSEDSSFQFFVSGFSGRAVGNVTSYQVSEAFPGTDYYYRVRAEVDGLVSANSEVINLTTFPDVPVALAASERNALEFIAGWQAAEGARSYEVDVSGDSQFESMVPGYEAVEVSGTTTLKVSDLEPGKPYFYRVRSVAGPRKSAPSNVVQTSTLSISAENSLIEQQQLRILANGVQTNPVQIHVKSDEGIPLRNLRISLEPESGQPSIQAVEPVTNADGIANFALSSLEAEMITFRVLTRGILIGTFTVEFLANDGILTMSDNYPNPFREVTTLPVTVPRRMMIRIVLYNTLGKPVLNVISEEMETGYYEIPVRAHSLASGLYFYRLYTEEKILTESMTLIR